MGEAASAFADLCRGRWKAATGRTAPAHAAIAHDWPDAPCASEIRGCEVAIALTDPGSGGRPRRRDVFRLTFDAIASARESLYIEAQYLASSVIARQLARHLRNRQGPEVVIVATRNTRGRFENMTMGYGMQRFVQRLRKADRYGRLRLSHAVVPDGEGAETSVLIHSKLLIVDDRFVRVGSSNLNNRSMGFDTECDLAVEAGDDVSCRAAIAALRDDLLAEHLNTSSAAFAEERQRGGLLHALDSFNTDARGLRPLTVERDRPNLLFALIKAMLDPKRPYWPLPLLAIPLRRLCRSGLRLMRQNV
nr:phospholipase D-like domain-containing protein [Allorhizobium sonneratiae]